VTTAEFQAHPTYLDLDDLRSGVTDPAAQTDELSNVLLMASAWADGWCNQPLGAHEMVQRTRARCDRFGMVSLHADHNPVLALTGFAYGWTPTAMTSLGDLSGAWIEDARQIMVPLAAGGPWSGSLQFGAPAAGGELFVTATYTAGWVSTALAEPVSSGAGSITVVDPAGILPGSVLRLWEPGVEECVTVAGTYTAGPVVPLAVPLGSEHGAGAGLSGMPAEMRLAVINYAISQLMRPDTASEDAYPDTSLASGTRQTDPRRDGSGLVAEAQRLLAPYRRVR